MKGTITKQEIFDIVSHFITYWRENWDKGWVSIKNLMLFVSFVFITSSIIGLFLASSQILGIGTITLGMAWMYFTGGTIGLIVWVTGDGRIKRLNFEFYKIMHPTQPLKIGSFKIPFFVRHVPYVGVVPKDVERIQVQAKMLRWGFIPPAILVAGTLYFQIFLIQAGVCTLYPGNTFETCWSHYHNRPKTGGRPYRLPFPTPDNNR